MALTGEQWDSDLGFYYLRARYSNPQTGRFWTMDSYQGRNDAPASLHKYLYCHSNPVNGADPSGHEFSMPGVLSAVSISEGLQTFKGSSETLVQWEMRDMQRQLLNDLNPNDLPGNLQLGAEGERVWANYLIRNDFRAFVTGNVSAVGPDLVAARASGGRLQVVIGEVKASRSRLPGVSKLKWNIMKKTRQMSFNWLDRYASDIVRGLITLGIHAVGNAQLEDMLRAGEIEIYLMGALKKNDNEWNIKGFRLLHVGGDEVDGVEDYGIPEIVKDSKVNSQGLTIP